MTCEFVYNHISTNIDDNKYLKNKDRFILVGCKTGLIVMIDWITSQIIQKFNYIEKEDEVCLKL